MRTVKVIVGEYSYQGFGEKVFFKFDNKEDADFLVEILKQQHIDNMTIINAPSEYFKPWSKLQKIMLQCC